MSSSLLKIGKGLLFVLILSVMFMPLKCSASEAILDDMYNNPSRYITYGYVGPGSMVTIDRDSLNVHLYNPPYYIIAVNSVVHSSAVDVVNGGPIEGTREPRMLRFRYDYAKKEVYSEGYDHATGQNVWELIETNSKDTSTASGWQLSMSGAEIAFFLAYGIPFYNPPIGSYSKDFIVNGRSYLPLPKLEGNGGHYYDHKNNKIVTVK